MNETLTSLRPKLVLYTSLDEAAEAVKKVEDEFLAILKEKIPGFLEPGAVEGGGGGGGGEDGLGTIQVNIAVS